MRCVLLAAVLVTASCATHAPAPPPPPAPDIPVPPLLNFSVAPERPHLVYQGQHDTSYYKLDSATGLMVQHTEVAGRGTLPDTNDAAMYYQAGLATIWRDPSAASAAFYWTSRLNPSWADPYFARWYVLHEATRWRSRPVPDSVRKRVDSLVVLALIRDPFFDERLLMEEFARSVRSRVALARQQVDAAVKQANLQRMEAGQPPILGAPRIDIPRTWYLTFADRHFDSAARDLGRLIHQHPDAIELYVYRAKAQYYLGQYDSAASTLTAAIGRIDKRDTTHVLPVYFSRELFYYAVAMAEEQAKHDSAARMAFRNTVTENLGFYMGHLHLASQALAAHDTATALAEARIAADIRPTDPVAQLFLGYALLNAQHPAEAAEHLQAGIDADPYYALLYYYEGQAYEAMNDTAASLAAYRGFLAHAARGDGLRKTAESSIHSLESAAVK